MQLAPEKRCDDIRELRAKTVATREESFAALVHRQSAFVFRVAFAVLRNAHDAEDVVQDTFLKIYKGSRLDAVVDERAYLARIAWRIAVGRRRRFVPMEVAEISPAVATPEQLATEADLERRMLILVEALSEELRHPLLLSITDELSSLEIAVILGIPEGTVRNRLFRARQQLRRKWTALERDRHGR